MPSISVPARLPFVFPVHCNNDFTAEVKTNIHLLWTLQASHSIVNEGFISNTGNSLAYLLILTYLVNEFSGETQVNPSRIIKDTDSSEKEP